MSSPPPRAPTDLRPSRTRRFFRNYPFTYPPIYPRTHSPSIRRNQPDAPRTVSIFSLGKMSGQLPGDERERGWGGERKDGCARRVIFFRRASLTSILSISTFPRRVSCRSAVSFSIYPRRLLSHFSFYQNRRVRPSDGEWTRANTTDKTKVCIAAGSRALACTRTRENARQTGGLINGLLAEGGCITGEKKISSEKEEETSSGESCISRARLRRALWT